MVEQWPVQTPVRWNVQVFCRLRLTYSNSFAKTTKKKRNELITVINRIAHCD